MSRRYVYDSGALIAIDEGNAAALRRHETRLNELDQVIVPALVAAQVVRDPRRQARLMLSLRGCDVVPFTPDQVTPVGTLLAGAGTSDVIGGLVAVTAARSEAAVVTTDVADIAHLLKTLGIRVPVLAP
jgi:predicted nucleic acid-binding protein